MTQVIKPWQLGAETISAEPLRLTSEKTALLLMHGQQEVFDPTIHLEYEAPTQRVSLTELGIDPMSPVNKTNAPAVMDFAHTSPFRLLSAAGIEAMRKAIFSKPVLENCPFKVKDGDGAEYTHWELRNTSKHSKFIMDFWKSPTVNQLMSDTLQLPVVPTMDLEAGHVNMQVPVMEKVENGITGWHTDGNAQFVCILMLSDAANMVGGETAFRHGDGTVAKIKFPAAGYAIMMQGMNIFHSVTDVTSAAGERLTMVCSYQPADYRLPQQAVIKYLQPLVTVEDRKQMFAEWTTWRLTVLSKRMADLAKQIEIERHEGKFDLARVQSQAAEFKQFLQTTLDEM